MRLRWTIPWLGALAAAAPQDTRSASSPASRRAADGTIRGAGRIEGRLDSGRRSAAYDVMPAKSGTLTIRLDAFDFDARLRVEDADQRTLDEDDRGWIEPFAACTVEAREGATLRIVADSREDGGRGEFALSVADGAVPRPEGEALMRAVVSYMEEGTARARARGDWTRAAALEAGRAEALASAGRVPEARAGLEAALKEARERSARAGEAILLSWKARREVNSGDRAKLRASIDEAARAARECGDPKTHAWMLCFLGSNLADLQDHVRSREFAAEALEIARRHALADVELEARLLDVDGRVRQGDLRGALPDVEACEERALEQRLYGRAILAIALRASCQEGIGARDAALASLGRCIELARRIHDARMESWAYSRLAILQKRMGKMRESEASYEAAIALVKRLDHVHRWTSLLGDLGSLQQAIGNLERARQLFQESSEMARRVEDFALESIGRGNLGIVQGILGDLVGARESLERALETSRELGDRQGEAWALNNLGATYLQLGNDERAVELFDASLAIAREIRDATMERQALSNRVAHSIRKRDSDRTEALAGELLELARRFGDRPLELLAIHQIANSKLTRNQPDEARALYEQELAAARELNLRQQIGRALYGLATIHVGEKRMDVARREFEEAVEMYDAVAANELAIGARNELARVLINLGELEGARTRLQEAEARYERSSGHGLSIEEASTRRAVNQSLSVTMQVLIARRLEEAKDAAARAALVAEGFEHAGRWKSRALLEGIIEHRRGARSAETLAARRRWNESRALADQARARLSRALAMNAPASVVEDLRRAVDELADRVKKAETTLSAQFPREASIDVPRGATLDQVRAALPPGARLVEFVEGERSIYAYVVTDRTAAHYAVGMKEQLGPTVEAFVGALSDPSRLASAADVASLGRQLHETLLAPALAADGAPATALVVVPSPVVAGLPFDALVAGAKRERPSSFADVEFVIERLEVTYAPSSPVLVELAAMGPRAAPGRILVLADPRYRNELEGSASASRPEAASLLGGTRGLPAPAEFQRLEKTRVEALALARLALEPDESAAALALARLTDERSGSLAARRCDLHLGKEASTRRLKGDLRGYAVLHLAAHGYVDRERPMRTGLALAYDDESEGYFTVADALDLDLDANIVVLSACDTARGEIRAGEGVQSSARAFQFAGARAVVASLWQLADREAAETMEAFYRGALREGMPTSRALRAAKLALRRAPGTRGVGGVTSGAARGASMESGHPFFWAPLIHIGLSR